MDWLKELDLQRWWIAAIAVGLVVIVAALTAKNNAVAIIGFGIIACGFGEWFNHRMEIQIIHGGTLTTYPRFNRSQGLALVALGIILTGFGLYRLMTL
jgi:hypothetical protein